MFKRLNFNCAAFSFEALLFCVSNNYFAERLI